MSTQAAPEPSDRELQTNLDGFFKIIRTMADDTSCRYIGEFFKQNTKLTKENERLTETEEINLAQIAKLDQKLKDEKKKVTERDTKLAELMRNLQGAQEEAETTKKDLQKKGGELDATAEETTKLMQKLKNHESGISALETSVEEMKKQLETSRENEKGLRREKESIDQRLEKMSERLKSMESFVCPMESWKKEEIVKKLSELSTGTYKLVKDYFSDNLADNVCKDVSKWEKLRNHAVVCHPHKIPLPSSNSPHAKQMRVVAVLAVLAHHLAEQIFQPLYVLEEGGELHNLLSDLANENPQREAFLRSALLATLTRKEQQANSQKRIQNVLLTVFSNVQLLLQDGKQESFRRGLEDLCTRSCEIWSELQRLEDKVEWSFEVEDSDDWDLLELPQPAREDNASRVSSSNQAVGPPKAAPTRQTNRPASPASQRSSNMANQQKVDIGNIVGSVWPCFLCVRKREIELLRKGFALGEAQIKVAKSEASSLKRSITGSHREARQRARTLSVQRSGDGAEKAKSFLSQNGSAGPKGG